MRLYFMPESFTVYRVYSYVWYYCSLLSIPVVGFITEWVFSVYLFAALVQLYSLYLFSLLLHYTECIFISGFITSVQRRTYISWSIRVYIVYTYLWHYYSVHLVVVLLPCTECTLFVVLVQGTDSRFMSASITGDICLDYCVHSRQLLVLLLLSTDCM